MDVPVHVVGIAELDEAYLVPLDGVDAALAEVRGKVTRQARQESVSCPRFEEVDCG